MTGYLIAAAGIILLTAAAWAWLRPRHGIHERREQAAALEADAFLETLRDAPAPADERLADTDVRRAWQQPPRRPGPAAGPAMPLGLPARPPAPGVAPDRKEDAHIGEPGAGATWAQDPATVTPDSVPVAARYPGIVFPRTGPPLPHVGVVIPPPYRAIPDVYEPCWCMPGRRRGHIPEWAATILHHDTTAEAVEADSMTMPKVIA